MAQDIDLMPQEAVQKEITKGLLNKNVNVAAIVSLLIIASVLAALFGWQLFLASSAQRIDSQTKDAQDLVIAQAAKEITHRALVEKLDDTKKFLDSRLLFASSYQTVLDVIKISGAILTESTLKNDGTFTISGDAKTTKIFNKVVSAFNDEKLNEDLKNIKLITLTKIPKEPYRFTIEYEALKKGLFAEIAEEGEE